MPAENFPIQKSDVHYNAATQEVSMEREKFDRLMSFVRGLVKELESAEDARDVARYKARRAEGVLKALKEDVQSGSDAIKHWLGSNSVRQLAQRSGISYATCYRMVKGQRLNESKVEMRDFMRLVETVTGGARPATSPETVQAHMGQKRTHSGHGRVVLATSHKKIAKGWKEKLQGGGIEMITIGSGGELLNTIKEEPTDLLILDMSLPCLKIADVVKQKDVPVLLGQTSHLDELMNTVVGTTKGSSK